MTYCKLESVQRPYQYVGHEENTYAKNFADASVKMCLAFPDAYEIGMSNVGMQIIYHIVNEVPQYLCDRVYTPLEDMGALLKASGQTLLGRESSKPLKDFDCIGFTLQYELCYTNILYMLDLAGIPLRSENRGESDPLIFAGGPCAFNPEPVADFFDFIVVGEGEEVITEVLTALEHAKQTSIPRASKLELLSRIRGVYVPSFYTPTYLEDGSFDELKRQDHAPAWVERRIVADLNKVKYPTKPVTPAITPIHERVSVEIQRGCTRSCRFCQAGYVYRPRRERDPNLILDTIDKSIQATGISEVGLLSLSSADYSQIHSLMTAVISRYRERNLTVSLPSTRLEALEEEYLDVFKEEKKSGFTIAPEAGSQRLRNVINKNFTEEEVVDTARMLFRNGWQSIKMYFMIGQPTETDDDVIAIAELANTVIRKTTDIPGRKAVTVSVSNFVPKPHTPFQWCEQISTEEFKRRQKLIRDHIQYKRQISFRSHAPSSSFVEGLVSRGDRRCASLIENAYNHGARFDCWQDKLSFEAWESALDQTNKAFGIDLAEISFRERPFEGRFPWHRIYSGLHPRFFKNEYQKAVYGVATEDCSFSSCHECGLCNEHTGVSPLIFKEPVPIEQMAGSGTGLKPLDVPLVFRMQHQKIGSAKFLSAIDLKNLFIRACKRAQIPLAYDEGMRPRPRLASGPALPLGVTSTSELIDIQIKAALDAEALRDTINKFLPPEVAVLTAAVISPTDAGITASFHGVSYCVSLDEIQLKCPERFPSSTHIASRIEELSNSPEILVTKTRKQKNGTEEQSTFNIKPSLASLVILNNELTYTLVSEDGQPPNPYGVLSAFAGLALEEVREIHIHKTGMLGKS